MEKHYSDDTFLARWISGELSPEELEAFKNSKDYPLFKKINQGSQQFEVHTYNKQEALRKLQEKLEEERAPKPRKLIPNWLYAAASIVVVLGILYFVNNKTSHFETAFGEQLALTLPDNSKVQLNANSVLEYEPKDWNNNRTVNLEGEAFFDVEKGSAFKVISNQGAVEVLGTAFNVIARDAYFEVQCHEGKVKVTAKNTDTILTPGKAIRLVNDIQESWSFQDDKPTWLAGESSFVNAPLSQVIKALQDQYNVTFDTTNIDLNMRFTGGFTHKNLQLALQTVFTPLKISVSVKDENIIILANQN